MQLIHINSSATTSTKKTVSLAGFKGTWVDVVEKIKYGSAGTYSLTIKKISDGTTLMYGAAQIWICGEAELLSVAQMGYLQNFK